MSLALARVLDVDPLDPRGWDEPAPWRRVFLSERNDRLFVIVDACDYEWAMKRSWSCHKQGDWVFPNYYARRTEWPHGTPFYMHVELLNLVEPAPSPLHVISDHRNGNTFDNRRSNLRWATVQENRSNRHGFWRGRSPEDAWRDWHG